jgi:putative heme-binding domain-containing protein
MRLLPALLALTAAALPAAEQKKANPIRPNPAELPPPADPAAINVPPGFKVEMLYSVPRTDQGSWVSLTPDPKGRLLASDQYGGIYRITVPPLGTSAGLRVEKLDIDLNRVAVATPPPEEPRKGKNEKAKTEKAGPVERLEVGAHGLLHAFGSLYVMVNENRARAGLWRLRDTNGDDQYDEVKYLRPLKGTGEHGTHSLVLSPDGQTITASFGNFTDLPATVEKTRPTAWDEDHLLPRMWDARGHARGRMAPGSHIVRFDPEGKVYELFSIGFRNQFDIAYDQNGELFTFDSDMEWDQGTPWYMPTRINHAVSGGDFGWRSGAGRWPEYYADSLGTVVDIGPGSPTGVAFGTGAKFPAKYQRAFFAADWTYGTLYAIHLQPEGAGFRGERTEFITGKPLPLTDVIIHPGDGAMYFAVGGRRTQSALYRVTYTGTESTAPVGALPPTAEAKARRALEEFHREGAPATAIDAAWPHLASRDRNLRFAARVALERQPSARWAERALAELQPQALIEAMIGLARTGDKALQPRLIAALGRLDLRTLEPSLRLPLLRAWQLVFARMGKPSAEVCATIAAKLDPLFPHADPLVNRELLPLLVFLDSRQAVAKAVPLLSVSEPVTVTGEEIGGAALIARNDRYAAAVTGVKATRPDRQQIALAYTLRHATAGWTPRLRTEFFSWFPRTATWKGGNSFSGFIQNIRTESLANVPDKAERAALQTLSQPPPPSFAAPSVLPQGPGRPYTLAEAAGLMPAKLSGRDFARGKAMYTATACILCHRFGDEGGSGVGPDLTGAGGRYSIRDLLENILEPSQVISDQFGAEQIERRDGDPLIGRVVGEENGELLVMANPFMPDEKVRVKATDITARRPYATSLMPAGLINSLNPEEIQDLLAYLLSGGNPQDPMFRR